MNISICLRSSCVAALTLAACAQAPFDPGPEERGAPCEIEGNARFQPMVDGAEWEYEVERFSSGAIETKIQSLGGPQDIGDAKDGITAYPLTTEKSNGTKVAWLEDTGSAAVRHREQDLAGATHHDEYFELYRVRLDEAPEYLAEGASFSHEYVKRVENLNTLQTTVESRSEEWTVATYGEEVTTPAGTFCTMQVTRVTSVEGVAGSEKQYWFARGVGKVKERSASRREELSDYSIP